MQHWNLTSHLCSQIAADGDKLCKLIGAIGNSDRTALAAAILALISPQAAISNCTVVAFEAERNPRLISASSQASTWQMFHCASEYVKELFRHDRIQIHLRGMLPAMDIGSVVIHRQMLEEVVDPGMRKFCGEVVGIVDGMSITVKTARRQWVTISLCRRVDQGLLSDAEIEAVRNLAPLIASATMRHCSLEIDGESDFRASVTNGLDDICAQLTTREREVILRILDGVTAERIAEDLGIRPTTVITYRTRAYEKLGVSSRRELFSAVLRNRNALEKSRPSDIYVSEWSRDPVALSNDTAAIATQ